MSLLPSAFVKHGLILNFTDSHSYKTPDPKSIKISSGIDSGTTSQLYIIVKVVTVATFSPKLLF